MTTKIQIPDHLMEYARKKYGTDNGCVRFPDKTDLYHIIYDLLEKRPIDVNIDKGNLEIFLPERSTGKSTETYNYLGIRSQLIIKKKLENMMWAEAHDFIDEKRHRFGMQYAEGVFMFMNKYEISGITEDAFLKNYYRWRSEVRRREKRSYNRQKSYASKCS